MATVVTVHGTFAHANADDKAAEVSRAPDELQWWQASSTFEHDMRDLIDAAPDQGTGKLDVTRFEWNGHNSEIARRQAGKRLFRELKALEAKGEPYAVIGHSHGGSVLGWALLESAARKEQLQGLKRWITVGTPFVSLKKEPLLFQRLDLMRKVIFVASFMLVLMFLVYLGFEALSPERMLIGRTFTAVLVVTGIMMSLPILVFYLVLKMWDKVSLIHYRSAVRARAANSFAGRWLPLTHTDDEAVQGLAFLPGAKLSFLDKSFAVPAITMISVVAVPLLYISLLASPTHMVNIADWLKRNVYDNHANPEAERALLEGRQRMRSLWSEQRHSPLGQRRAMWENYRELRRSLQARYPDLDAVERAVRFKQRFFERDGEPCEGGALCGGGHDKRINSALLLHLVTDELSTAIGGEGADSWASRGLLSLVIPAVLVPLFFGALSLVLMLVIRAVAKLLSHGASILLNSITNAEVKRAAFGNDTEGEVAVGAIDRPGWIDRSPPRLPTALGDLVTAYSNSIANQSLAKFRKAIGQLASAEPRHTADTAITTYFTWKELVHSSYFDVPEFRKLVAQSISRAEGFAPSTRFQKDPDYARTAQWLAEIEGTPGTAGTPIATPPTSEDAGAVAAVVASTVKQEP